MLSKGKAATTAEGMKNVGPLGTMQLRFIAPEVMLRPELSLQRSEMLAGHLKLKHVCGEELG